MVEFVAAQDREQIGKAMSQRIVELPAPAIDGVKDSTISLFQMQDGLVSEFLTSRSSKSDTGISLLWKSKMSWVAGGWLEEFKALRATPL
ncbi:MULTISPECIES: hypothetical protein [unclassified Pseudomonas]|jgi:hypothetical protein|uniref:hypothetical protein n=1 Tax=unclassified Pseudomonas TaxID=196821 RepID=UPI002A36B532|nr:MULTISPECIES: hypothetical protein [unclassified Pseudomonas]MDX9673385.1 hypothetical protein [Pseudomonas sp. P8_250]WPN38080.1 hypothetical protein QMK53_10625 [Pseudomonas sp. P8_139]WPN40117.1 hypothetical protein QMK55_20750 [Pseudomonas sp. P8_229]